MHPKCYIIHRFLQLGRCRTGYWRWPKAEVKNSLETNLQICLYSTLEDQGLIPADTFRSSASTNVSGKLRYSTHISDLLVQGDDGEEEAWGDFISVHEHLLRGE